MSGIRLAALLRGVNVGGVRMPMAEVRAAIEAAGGRDARTFLASGNATFEADDATAGAALVRDALRERFGYEAWIWVRPLTAVHDAVDRYPFDTDESTHHPYVTVADDPSFLADLLAAAGDPADGGTRARLVGDLLCWECPRGSSLDVPLAREAARSRYAATTTRNLRTLRKLA